MTVEVRPPKALVGDTLRVTVSVEAPAEYEVDLPTEQSFGDLGAKTIDSLEPRPSAAGRLWRRTFAIEPTTAGKLQIPALNATYSKPAGATPHPSTQPAASPIASTPQPALSPAAPSSQPTLSPPAASSAELSTDPLSVEIASSLTDKDKPTDPRDITGTLTPPRPPMPLWQKLVIAGAALVALVLIYVLIRVLRARALRPAPPLAPDAWALAQLARLSAPDPSDRSALATYYYQLTEIVRGYIERQFGVRAPDMTTEEFLVYVTRDPVGRRCDVPRLQAFLEACDLVKYAAWTPRREEAGAALDTAKAYVRETAHQSAHAGAAA